MKKTQFYNRGVLDGRMLVELKCFLQRPTESNVNILYDEMVALVKGPKEVEYYDSTPDIEKAMSLEDLFK